MSTLALDLGGNLGWAIQLEDRIIHGSAKLAKNAKVAYGNRFMALMHLLGNLKRRYGFTTVAFEMVNASTHRGKAQVALNSGYRAVVQMFAAVEGIREVPVHIGTAKKALTGSGKAQKSDMLAGARAIGLHPKTEDEADAIGVLCAAMLMQKHEVEASNGAINETKPGRKAGSKSGPKPGRKYTRPKSSS